MFDRHRNWHDGKENRGNTMIIGILVLGCSLFCACFGVLALTGAIRVIRTPNSTARALSKRIPS